MSHWSTSVPASIVNNARFLKYRRRILKKPHVLSPRYKVLTNLAKLATVGISVHLLLFWDFRRNGELLHDKDFAFNGVRRWYRENVESKIFKLTAAEMEEYKANCATRDEEKRS